MTIQNAIPPDYTASPKANDDSSVDNQSISDQFDGAVFARNPNKLLKIAQDNPGPVADAASHVAKVINDGKQEWADVTKHIESAKTEPEKNIAIANAYKTTRDDPQWGRAWGLWLGGDLQGAQMLITGGRPTTTTGFFNDSSQYKEVKNELGEIESRTDMKTGKSISPEEFQAKGGGHTTLDSTLNQLSRKALVADNTTGLLKTRDQSSGWQQTLTSQMPEVKVSLDAIDTLSPKEIKSAAFTNAIKNLASSSSAVANSSKSASALKQLTENAGGNIGKQVDKKLAAQFNLGPAAVYDSGGVTDSNKKHWDFSELKSQQDTASSGTEFGKQISTNRDAMLDGLRNEGFSDTEQRKLQQVYDNFAKINKQNFDLSESIGKPNYIQLPSIAHSQDGYANMKSQLMQTQFNKDAVDAFNEFFNKSMKNYEPGELPNRGELEQRFINTKEYKKLQHDYALKVQAILDKSTIPEQPTTANKKPVAQIPTAVKVESGSVKPTMSLNDIAKGLNK